MNEIAFATTKKKTEKNENRMKADTATYSPSSSCEEGSTSSALCLDILLFFFSLHFLYTLLYPKGVGFILVPHEISIFSVF